MYDGWVNLVGPVVFSGIITLAVWVVPQLRKQGAVLIDNQRGRIDNFLCGESSAIPTSPSGLSSTQVLSKRLAGRTL